MKRLTMKDVHAMNMTELALNQVSVENGQAWYLLNPPEDACRIEDLIRKAAETLDVELEAGMTDEDLGEVMLDWLQFGEKEPEGVLAIFYRALWAMAEVRERLKLYEDAMPLERSQELAKAEKEGRLVVLPFCVGVPLYEATGKGVWEYQVEQFSIGSKDLFIQAVDKGIWYKGGRIFGPEQIGKTVFPTRREAEAALETRMGAINEA